MTSDQTVSEAPHESQALPSFPVTYEHSRTASALYFINGDVAIRHLAHTRLTPVTIGNRAVANVSWFDYGSSSIGPYQELSIGILASPHRTKLEIASRALLGNLISLGTYLVALPVSSELARVAGVLRLGLPKTLMQIPLTWSSGALDAAALEAGRRILSMRIPLGIGPQVRIPALTLYSELAGSLLRTRVETDFPSRVTILGRPKITIEQSNHPLSEAIVRLGLLDARCVGVFHGPIRSATLFAPDVID